MIRQYDAGLREYFVARSLDSGKWATYYTSRKGTAVRLNSPSVPPRPDQSSAQKDLDKLARRRRWRLILVVD